MANEVRIVVRADDQASRTFKNVEKSAGGLVSGLKTVSTVGAAALGAMAGAVAITGGKFDAMKQQAQIAFSTMLGSGKAAEVFLKQLQDFAAKTPFEFTDLTRASQRLLAMGFAAKDILPMMTAVGDAVAGLGGGAAEIDQVTRALGQMNAKGKTSAEEMLQLTEAGIPAWQMLADKIGTSVPEAMKKVEKGSVAAKTTIDAVVEGMEKKFGGMMDQQSRTFNGLLSTAKDTFAQLSGKVMEPFFEQATKGLKAITDYTSKPEFTRGVEKFAEIVDGLSDSFRKGFEATIIPALKWVADNGQRVAVAVSAIGLAFAFAHPAAAVMVGLGGLITLIGILKTKNEDASDSVLRMKDSFLDMAETAVYALGVVAKQIDKISHPSISIGLPGIGKVGAGLGVGPMLGDETDALLDAIRSARSGIGAEQYKRSQIGLGFAPMFDFEGLTAQAILASGGTASGGGAAISTAAKKAAEEAEKAAERLAEEFAKANDGAMALADALKFGLSESQVQALNTTQQLHDAEVALAEAVFGQKTAVDAETQARLVSMTAQTQLIEQQAAEQKAAFDLAVAHEKLSRTIAAGGEAAKKMIAQLATTALDTARSALGSVLGGPTQEQAKLGLQKAKIDEQIARAEAEGKSTEKLRQQAEAIQKQIDVMTAHTAVLRAQGEVADKTLLTQKAQDLQAQEMIKSIAASSAELVKQFGKDGFVSLAVQSARDALATFRQFVAEDLVPAVKGQIAEFTGAIWRASGGLDALGGLLYQMAAGREVPGYASGTSYVPSDGLAYLHRGEAVIPANQNRATGGVTVNIQNANFAPGQDANSSVGDVGWAIMTGLRARGMPA